MKQNWIMAALAGTVLLLGGCSGEATPAATNPAKPDAPKEAAKAPGTISRNGDMLPADFAPEYRSGVTLVFYAKVGCKACAQMEPIYEEVLKRCPSGARSIKMYPYMIDLDYYRVEELPTLVIYRDGKEQKRFVGVTPGQKLLSALQSAL